MAAGHRFVLPLLMTHFVVSSCIQSQEERDWFAENFEVIQQEEIPAERKVEMAKLMLKAQVGYTRSGKIDLLWVFCNKM